MPKEGFLTFHFEVSGVRLTQLPKDNVAVAFMLVRNAPKA